MKQHHTKVVRIPITIVPTIERITELYGCKTSLEAFEILCDFFNEHCTLEKNVKSLYEKLDMKVHKIIRLLEMRIELKHIVIILSDEINEILTEDDFKNYLIIRKIVF